MVKLNSAVAKKENLFFLFIVLILAIYSHRVVEDNLVLNPLYFYKNEMAGLVLVDYNLNSLNTYIASGLLGHLIVMAIDKLAFSSIIVPTLIAISTFTLAKILFSQIRYFFAQSLSFLLLLIILFTPLSGEIRNNLNFFRRGDMYGLLFASFPYPQIVLIGLILVLNFYFQHRNSLSFPTKRALVVCVLTFSIHPFLFFFFMCCLVLHVKFLKSRGLGLLESKKARLFLLALPSFLLLYSILSILIGPEDLLGTLTFDFVFQFNSFEFFFYMLLPVSSLVFALLFINVSLYELVMRFYPILVLFSMELTLILFSFLSDKDFTVFLRFNGLSQVAHILYYIPAIYVLVSFEKRQRIKFIYFDEVGGISNFVITKFLPVISLFLTLIIVATTVVHNWPIVEKPNNCSQIDFLKSAWQKGSPGVNSKATVYAELLSIRKSVMDSEEFARFMEQPLYVSSGTTYERGLCDLQGIGFLVLNGFNFSYEAVNRAKTVSLDVEERVIREQS